MTSTRPYLIRAFYEWITDNGHTPYIVVNVNSEDLEVPMEYVENGQITLNVAMTAVQSLLLENDAISFQARFNGIVKDIYVPILTVTAIYAKENGRGMVFTDEDDSPSPSPKGKVRSLQGRRNSSKSKEGKVTDRSHLTVVK